MLLLGLLDHVARDDVTHLVRHDAGEHVHFVRLRDQSAIDVDVPARDRESVYRIVIDDIEVERPIREGCLRMQPLADLRDVRVGADAHLLRNLRSHLIAELPLLIE